MKGATLPTRDELFLAYRQAKTALFYERRGVGLIELARFEHKLKERLDALAATLATNDGWFDGLQRGELWITPKKIRSENEKDGFTRIGAKSRNSDLEVQIRYIPSPECAIVEVLFLWRFGHALQTLLSKNAIGYRLDVRRKRLDPTRRWLFEYWPTRYNEFRRIPVDEAMRELDQRGSVLVLSADLASFYDTVDPSFLLSDDFVSELEHSSHEIDVADYRQATRSLLGFYSSFRSLAQRRTGLDWPVGIPIGCLTSRVVANVALASLDRAVEERNETRCYRRYVDDFVIVARTDNSDPGTLEQVVRKYIPHVRDDDGGDFRLNVDSLSRKGSEFTIRRDKCKAHHLVGPSARTFLATIRRDFERLVSEDRAFLDSSVLLEDVAEGAVATVVQAGLPGRPLTVLRDVDRSRLEHYALSIRLRSLERVSVLVGGEHSRRLMRSTLEDVLRFLEGDRDWVDNLEASLRILRLWISTGQWDNAKRLIDYMDGISSDVERLRESIDKLVHRGRKITRASAWIWLRNYLHARRTEAICSVVQQSRSTDEFPDWWRSEGVRERTRMIRWRTFIQRARWLAAADLRSFDREDDAFGRNAYDTKPSDAHFGHDDENLDARLKLIEKFTRVCSQLGENQWKISASSLFLCTRPPSYFDVACRWLYHSERKGFDDDVFGKLLKLVNAIRGTQYYDPVGKVIDKHTVRIPDEPAEPRASLDPRLILGNLVASDKDFAGAAMGKPVLTVDRLRRVAAILEDSLALARRKPQRQNLLVLPELSLPRAWFRHVANHVAATGAFGLIAGIEYLRHPKKSWVYNQAWIVMPGPFRTVAAWPWTKLHPAREEERELDERGVSFRPLPGTIKPRRTVVNSPYGDISVLICSELMEARSVSDLVGRVEIVAVPSWNKDTSAYDYVIQSVGLQLHAIVAVANNGRYSDCRAWAPRRKRWERDLCRLIERNQNHVVFAEIPLSSLKKAREAPDPGSKQADAEWKPLPPDWP